MCSHGISPCDSCSSTCIFWRSTIIIDIYLVGPRDLNRKTIVSARCIKGDISITTIASTNNSITTNFISNCWRYRIHNIYILYKCPFAWTIWYIGLILTPIQNGPSTSDIFTMCRMSKSHVCISCCCLTAFVIIDNRCPSNGCRWIAHITIIKINI